MAEELKTETRFKIQLERLEAKLKVVKNHAAGPKKPTMGQQEHGE